MSTGRLVLVGTPIGNLGDLSPRAIEALEAADIIACEDTRRTGRLLQLTGIAKSRLITVNEHSEFDQIDTILGEIDKGAVVVLVSDAGMPGISDPGELLVSAAAERGITVETVPGPSAALTALVLSGLAASRFCFEGFLPRKGRLRSERISQLVSERRTAVIFEAPHRLERTVQDLSDALGDHRRVALARELTKLHEQVWRGTLAEAQTWCAEQPRIRGEFVIVLEGADPPELADDEQITVALRSILKAGGSRRDAVDEVSRSLSVAHRRVYSLALAIDR